MMDPSRAAPAPSDGPTPILEGRPIAKEMEWQATSSHFYCAAVLHVSPEIQNDEIITRLTKRNLFLCHLTENVFTHIDPIYTKALQRELDSTPHQSLEIKLDTMLIRERARYNITPAEADRAIMVILNRRFSNPYP